MEDQIRKVCKELASAQRKMRRRSNAADLWWGLTGRTMKVALSIYILSSYDVALAVRFATSARKKRKALADDGAAVGRPPIEDWFAALREGTPIFLGFFFQFFSGIFFHIFSPTTFAFGFVCFCFLLLLLLLPFAVAFCFLLLLLHLLLHLLLLLLLLFASAFASAFCFLHLLLLLLFAFPFAVALFFCFSFCSCFLLLLLLFASTCASVLWRSAFAFASVFFGQGLTSLCCRKGAAFNTALVAVKTLCCCKWPASTAALLAVARV